MPAILRLYRIILERLSGRQAAVSDAIEDQLAAQAASPKHAPKRRGRKPKAREEVTAAMLADLRSGEVTAEELQASEVWLESRYGRSRDTCRKARDAALSEFRKRQIPTIDK